MALAFLLLGTNISFAAPAARAENLLPSLAVAIGQKLECAPECRDEVLLIDVKDVDPSHLLKRIAEAADAEWQTKPDGTLLLTRPIALVTKERSSALAARAAEIATLQRELKARTDALPVFDLKEAQLLSEAYRKLAGEDMVTPPRGGAPGNRLAAKILCRLPAADLASMRDGQRLVYTTRPTTWQRSLPKGLEGDLAQFAKEQSIWSTETGGTGGESASVISESSMSSATGQPPYSLHVRVSRYSDISPAGVSVTVVDRAGKAFAQAQAMLVTKGFQQYTAPKTPSILWDLPEVDAVWGAATNLTYRSGTTLPSAELIQKVTHPDKFDPLSFVLGPALVETARRRGHGIVANLPDNLMGEVEVRDGKVDLSEVERKLVLQAVRHDDTGPIELVVPVDPLRAREIRTDRHALARFASAVHVKGMLRLDDLADYAAVSPVITRGWDGLSFYTVRVLLPRAERLAQFEDGRFLRLYGNLTPTQRKAMRNGQLTGSVLSPAGKSALLDLILNGGLRANDTQGIWRTSPFQPEIALDPTTLLPASGILGFTIKGQAKVSPALLAGSPEHGKWAAWTSVQVGGPNLPLSVLEGSELWPGEIETITFELGSGAVAWSGSLTDHRIRMDGPPTSPDKLPYGLRPVFRPFEP